MADCGPVAGLESNFPLILVSFTATRAIDIGDRLFYDLEEWPPTLSIDYHMTRVTDAEGEL